MRGLTGVITCMSLRPRSSANLMRSAANTTHLPEFKAPALYPTAGASAPIGVSSKQRGWPAMAF